MLLRNRFNNEEQNQLSIITDGHIHHGGNGNQRMCPSPAPVTDMRNPKVLLTPDPQDKSLLWWEARGFSWHRYHSIFLESVVFNLTRENLATTLALFVPLDMDKGVADDDPAGSARWDSA